MEYKCQNCGELLESPTTHSCVLNQEYPVGTLESVETFDNGESGIGQIRVKRVFDGTNLTITLRNSTVSEIQDYLAQVALDNAQFLEE